MLGFKPYNYGHQWGNIKIVWIPSLRGIVHKYQGRLLNFGDISNLLYIKNNIFLLFLKFKAFIHFTDDDLQGLVDNTSQFRRIIIVDVYQYLIFLS